MRTEIHKTLLIVALLLPAAGHAGDVQKGLDAYNVGDYETSLTECQPAAEAGDAAAQFCVGRLYANGFGVAMDDALALKWYGLAAEQGHSEAQFNLGVMNANGWGVPMDDAIAAKWYRLAAEQGHLQAQTSLANSCHSGRGVEQDLVQAYMWYAVAAGLGDMNAEFKLDEIVPDLSAEQIAEAKALAQSWLDAHPAAALQAGRLD